MKKLSSLFLASAILFSATPSTLLSDSVENTIAFFSIVAACYFYDKNKNLKAENEDLKAKLEKAQANQHKQNENILDKEIRPELTK